VRRISGALVETEVFFYRFRSGRGFSADARSLTAMREASVALDNRSILLQTREPVRHLYFSAVDFSILRAWAVLSACMSDL
jgi:hypothetical protein